MADEPPRPEQPQPEQPQPAPPPRRLTRSSSDRVIGGVAGGLAEHFGVDAILFRIAFVIFAFAGGFGVLAYLALLAFVPSDGAAPSGGATKATSVVGAVLLGVLAVAFLGPPLFFAGPGVLAVGVVVLIGVLLYRAAGGSLGFGDGTGGGAGDAGPTAARVAVAALLGIVAVGGFLGVGVAAALGGGPVIATLAIVAGLVLIATAFVGGLRWLIVPALVLVLPLGVVSAADLDFHGGVGQREYRPQTMQELQNGYRLGAGELVLDLSGLELPAGRTDVGLDLGMGHAVVYVPRGACVSSDVQIGVGQADVLERVADGVDVRLSHGGRPAAAPELHVRADVGAGAVEVHRTGFPGQGACS
jgi:phage shock protein PspC (stress-responsive transcriptional regulator)